MDLSLGISLLREFPEKAAAISEERALAKYLSNFARYFATGIENEEPKELYPPGFWLFLPFSTATDFPEVTQDQMRQLAVASTCMIIYNILFDATVDNPGRPDLHTQVLAEYALASMDEQLYALFPSGSPFWEHFRPMVERFLASMIEERTHKGKPRPYPYEEYDRVSRQKMSMVLVNPIGLAVLGNVPERIPTLLSAWDELDVAVVIIDDIKDWEEDYRDGNYTFMLAQALGFNDGKMSLPKNEEELITQVVFSGAMEDLYERGAWHLDRAVALAHEAKAPALAQLAEERAVMFRKFGRQLMLRKLDGLREHIAGTT